MGKSADASGVKVATASGTLKVSTSIEQPNQFNARTAAQAYGKLPLHFERNEGQAHAHIKSLSHGRGYGLFLTSSEALLSLSKQNRPASTKDAVSSSEQPRDRKDPASTPHVVRMKVVGANRDVQASGEDKLVGKINYLIGGDPSKWRTDIPSFAKVSYIGVYRGIDLIYHGDQGLLEYDFVVAPKANPHTIRLSFAGSDRLELDASGNLIMHVESEELRQPKPTAYQEAGGIRKEVAVQFELHGRSEISFRLGPYDTRVPLTIDPVLSYSSYLGGNGDDAGNGIAVDKAGNAYVTGYTSSSNFPAANPIHGTNRDNSHYDAFVSKVNASGTALIYSTYIGGTNDDHANGIALDSQNNVYITGDTNSADFPTINAIQLAYNFSAGGQRCHTNAFVTKLSAAGDAILYSTYLGGKGDGRNGDQANGIAVDNLGAAYVTGTTFSGDFPTANALQPNHAGNSFFKTADGGVSWGTASNLPKRSIITIAADTKTPSTLYVSLTDGGVWKSTDGGATWTERDNGINTAGETSLIAVDPTNSANVYAAGDGNLFSGCAYEPGVYKSTDGAAHWTAINNGLTNKSIRALAIDPKTPTTLYVGTYYNPDPSKTSVLIFKSTDGGVSWNPSESGLFHPGSVQAIAVDPVNTSTLYAALGSCVYKSTDGAATWSTWWCDPDDYNVSSIAIDPLHPTTVYLAAAGVTKLGGSGQIDSRLLDFNTNSIVIDPASPSTIYVATGSGIFKSTSGAAWNRVTIAGTNLPSIRTLTINPANSTLYAALPRQSDAFVAKIDPSGSSLNYSTFLGGMDEDEGTGIAVDGSGAYLVGSTKSLNFPTQSTIRAIAGGGTRGTPTEDLDPFGVAYARPAPCSDAFVTKISATGATLAYSTYIGGNDDDYGSGIAVDLLGNAYVTGSTSSQTFPVVNAFQPGLSQSPYDPYRGYSVYEDAFVTKIDSAGDSLVYSTYLGGHYYDEGQAIAVDATGVATVTGYTDSADFPLPHKLKCTAAYGDAFVTRFNPAGNPLRYASTVFGGGSTETGNAIALDDSGNAYVTGETYSFDFPTVNGFQPAAASSTCGFLSCGDAYVSKIAPGVSGADVAVLKCVGSEDEFIKFTDTNYTYTLEVTNDGPQKATGVVVSDTLPAGVRLVSATSSLGACSGTSTVTCNLGDIGNGDLVIITLVVKPDIPGTIINSASVTSTSSDPNPTNNSSSVTTYASEPPKTVQYSSEVYSVNQACTTLMITITRRGDASAVASVDYSSDAFLSSARMAANYGHVAGHLRFAPGETSKSFPVLITKDVAPTEAFGLYLTNYQGFILGFPHIAKVYVVNQPWNPTSPIDAQDRVCQQYHDFLNRQPDLGGLDFWTNQITSCGSDQACIEARQINVATAFFLSTEFQQTGYLVYRSYKAAFGNLPAAPVPIRVSDFLTDTQQVGQGVVVGQAGWEQALETNKQTFFADFVQRSQFTIAYPTWMTPVQFVDALFANAGVIPSALERESAIGEFNGAGSSADNAARARVLRRVAENSTLAQQEFNRAFVLMQYFGYLRRNPNEGRDVDYSGYNFWLTKLNQFNGDFQKAEMVKAFISSTEYRQRFGP